MEDDQNSHLYKHVLSLYRDYWRFVAEYGNVGITDQAFIRARILNDLDYIIRAIAETEEQQ